MTEQDFYQSREFPAAAAETYVSAGLDETATLQIPENGPGPAQEEPERQTAAQKLRRIRMISSALAVSTLSLSLAVMPKTTEEKLVDRAVEQVVTEAPEEIPAVPEPESSGEEPPAEPTLQGFYKYGMIDTPIERRLETSSRTLQQPADARC